MKSQLFSVVSFLVSNVLTLKVIKERLSATDEQIKHEGMHIMERLGLDYVIIQKEAYNGAPAKEYVLEKFS